MLQGKSLFGDFIKFIIPSVMAQWVYTLYTMVDGMFVAKGVSEIALTAVNISFPYIAFLFSLSLMFAVGTSTISAIYMGKGENHKASEVFTQNIVVQIILSIIIVVAIMMNLEKLALFLGAPDEETLNYVVHYLRFIVPFSLAFLLSYSFEILLKTDGFPKKAMVIVIVGAVENCILDWLFVMVLHKGVQGAAFATSISQVTIIFLYLHHFLSGKGVLRFVKFKFDLGLLGREIRNGFSSGITELSSGLVTFVFNQVILTYLTRDALVSYTVVSYVNSIVVLSATGIAQGSQPLISFYYGQKNLTNCKKLLKYNVLTAGIFCIAAFAIGMVIAGPLVGVYVRPELAELRTYSVMVFKTFIISFLLVGFNVAISGYFTSVEQAVPALIISAGRGFVTLIGSLLLLANIFGGDAIWWAPTVSEAICLVVSLVLFVVYCKKNKFWRGEIV